MDVDKLVPRLGTALLLDAAAPEDELVAGLGPCGDLRTVPEARSEHTPKGGARRRIDRTVSSTSPFSVGSDFSAPSSASVRETGRSAWMSLPSRRKKGSAATSRVTYLATRRWGEQG